MTQHDEAIAAIHDHGFFIFEDAIGSELCDALLDEIERFRGNNVPLSLVNDFHGHNTERYYDVLNYGAPWQEAATHPNILPIIRGVLGDDCLLNTYGTSIIGPGEPAQAIHVDDAVFTRPKKSALRHRPHLGGSRGRESIVLNTMIALSDFTESVGATRVVPDSQRLPYPRPSDSNEWASKSIPAEMPKGSVVFFDGQCFHGGGANTTENEYRYGVTIHYCVGYLRTQENFLLSLGEERIEQFDDDLQRLLGFGLSENGIGHVYNHHPKGLMKRVLLPHSV